MTTSDELTVVEMLKIKRDVEVNICNILQGFNELSSLRIENIRLFHSKVIGSTDKLVDLLIELRI